MREFLVHLPPVPIQVYYQWFVFISRYFTKHEVNTQIYLHMYAKGILSYREIEKLKPIKNVNLVLRR